MRSLLKWLVRIALRVRVLGDTAPVGSGGALVISNHDSLLDGVLLGLFLPARAWIVFAPEDMTLPVNRLAARWLRHHVLDLSHPACVKQVLRLLAARELVVVFPQGRVTTTGSAMKLYSSVATMVAYSGTPLVPVHIDGLLYSQYGCIAGNFPRRRLPRVTIRIQAPVHLPEPVSTVARSRRRQVADALAAAMQRMVVDARARQTLYEAFIAAVQVFGRGYPITEDIGGRCFTYGDLLRQTLMLARAGARIAGARDVVGVLMPNTTATVCLLLGLSAAGRVPAMLNYTSGTQALRSACTAANVGVVITSHRFVEAAGLSALIKALDGLRIVYIEDLRAQFGWFDRLWLLGWATWRPRAALKSADPASAAVVLFTSGSETRPKGVALSHDALLCNIAQIRSVLDFSPQDRFLCALPMFHAYGLTACTLMPLTGGARLHIYTTPLNYRAIPEIAYRRDCTYVFGTSTFLHHYGRAAHPGDFYRARYVISGAEKLHPEVADLWLEKFGLRIIEGYGTTECAPVLALNAPLAYRKATVGRLLPGVEHRLVPVDGIGRGGRLHVRAPNLMLGYYLYERPGVLQHPRSEAGVNWYDTGDVVEIDADGFVTVLGRIKRFAKIAGEMVALELVERIAYHASPRYEHAATVELKNGGENTVLFTTDACLTRALLQRSARLLGGHDLAAARRVVHVDRLPRLGSGKTDYVALQDSAGDSAGIRLSGVHGDPV